MRSARLDRILLGTALALVLAAPGMVRAETEAVREAPAAAAPAAPASAAAQAAPEGSPEAVAEAVSEAVLETTSAIPAASAAAAEPEPVAAEPDTASAPAQASGADAPAERAPVDRAAAEPAAPASTPASAAVPVDTAAPDQQDSAQVEPAVPADASTASATPAEAPATAAPVAEAPAAPAPAATAAEPVVTPPSTASAPAAAPQPTASQPTVATLAPADQALAENLSALMAGPQFTRMISNRKERDALKDFYEARAHAPVWLSEGEASPRARAAMKQIGHADDLGLDPKDYDLPNIAAAGTAAAQAEAELKFAAAVLTYARHVQSGRTDPSRVAENVEIDYTLPMPEPLDVLTQTASSDIVAALESFEPPHEGYRILKRKLAELRGAPEDRAVPIPAGRVLRVNAKKPVSDARVPLLRERLAVAGDKDSKVYDADVAAAVKAYQAGKGLSQTGTLTAATVDALNGARKGRQIDAIVATMERWRWMPRDLGDTHVMMNIPDFTLRVVKDGSEAWRTRVVVGKPATATPIFSSEFENILVNPTWHVPDSIAYGQYLPALRKDPTVLQRMGLNVRTRPDGTVAITQPPGPRNALGHIKFNLKNRFSVYFHDTPDKSLFSHDRRAYSAGCMRVQNPDQFGEILASIGMPDKGYTAGRLKQMYGKGEAWLKFQTRVPVHLTYQTAFVDSAGKLVVREDIYGLDKRVIAALKGADRGYGREEVVKIINRAPPRSARQQVVVREEPPPVEDFFSRLFRR